MRAAIALCLLTACTNGSDAPARFLDAHTWQVEDADFGGFSALHLSDDGVGMIAVSDRGTILHGRLERQGDAITGVQIDEFTALRTDRSAGPPSTRDSEGLAVAPDGTTYVSFEGITRVLRLSSDGPATRLPDHPAFAELPANAALEALAIDGEGRLYTLPEKSGGWQQPFPVWRFDGTDWQKVFDITRTTGFLPVGADFGPDGAFYVLERGFNGIGFRTRVRRFDMPASGTRSGEVLFSAPVLRHDNLEGISVWHDTQGRTRLSMISDDNFRVLQRTEIVEYVIAPPLQ